MLELNEAFDTSLVVATHDLALAKKMGRVITIEDGGIKGRHRGVGVAARKSRHCRPPFL